MPKEYVTEPETVNGYRISFNGTKWQAVKDGCVYKTHMLKHPVIRWASKN